MNNLNKSRISRQLQAKVTVNGEKTTSDQLPYRKRNDRTNFLISTENKMINVPHNI